MANLKKDTSDVVILMKKALSAAFAWTLLCVLSAYWNIDTEKNKTLDLAKKEALTVFSKDQAIRFWATEHEGVYVPVTKTTSPNPYLKHIRERDLVTPAGRELTLMNPAYMLRQVMGHYASLYSAKGHITSLNTLNPINKPDGWELKALQRFDGGEREVTEVVHAGDKQFLRFMRPMYTKAGCLKCHAHQGYKIGDVRGGVSVSIPLAPYLELERQSILKLYISHLVFFFSGISVIAFFYNRTKQRIVERNAAAKTILEQSEKIKIFAYSVVHDLKSPVIALHGLTNLLKKNYQDRLDEKGKKYCDNIADSAERLDAFVGQLNEFISTKEHPLAIIEIDLLEICRKVRKEFDTELQERNIAWSEPSQNTIIRADRTAISRILRNFIDNALKYGGEGLTRIGVTYTDSGEFHTVCVSNDGNLVLPDAYRKLFIQFTRNCDDQNVAGTGLGLAIVKELVELHDGQVWGESDNNRGTTFCFTISKQL